VTFDLNRAQKWFLAKIEILWAIFGVNWTITLSCPFLDVHVVWGKFVYATFWHHRGFRSARTNTDETCQRVSERWRVSKHEYLGIHMGPLRPLNGPCGCRDMHALHLPPFQHWHLNISFFHSNFCITSWWLSVDKIENLNLRLKSVKYREILIKIWIQTRVNF